MVYLGYKLGHLVTIKRILDVTSYINSSHDEYLNYIEKRERERKNKK
jgi:hypothetical protein